MKSKIIYFLIIVVILLAGFANVANSQGATLWQVISNRLTPVVSSWGLRIPSLASTGNPCVVVGTTGIFATSTCGSGGGVDSVSAGNSSLTISPTVGDVIASLNTAHSNIWSVIQSFSNSSTTLGSFDYSSSTRADIGTLNLPQLAQGGLYVGSGNRARTVATSTATVSTGLSYSGTMGSMLGGTSGNLTVNATQNITNLSNLSSNGVVYTAGGNGTLNVVATSSMGANGTSILFSGTAGAVIGGTSGTYSLNMANANVWTALQTFGNSTTTYGSFTNASTTNLFAGTGQGALYTGSGARVSAVGTSTPTVSAPITYSGTLGQFLGGISGAFGCTNASSGVTGCLTGTDWNTFNGKESVLTFNYPLSRSVNAISYNGLGTTTTWSAGRVPYVVNGNTVSSVATTTVDCAGTASCSQFVVIGNTPVTITGAGSASGLGTTSPWTVGQLAMVSSNGSVTSISTSTLVNNIFPFTSYGISTSSVFNHANGLMSFGSTTLNGLKLTDLAQGWSYIGSNGLVQTTSTSSLANFILPFTSYGASTSTTLGLTGGLFSTASSTFGSALRLTSLSQGLAYIGSTGLVNTVATTSVTCSGSTTCTSFTAIGGAPITISSSGGSAGNATTTIPWILYQQGGSTNLYNTVSRTDVLSGTSFSTAMNFVINAATTTHIGQNTVFIREGYYSCNASIILNGNSTFVAPTLNIMGLASSTIIAADTAKCFDFRNDARFNADNLHVAFKANSNSFFTASSTAGVVQASIQNSNFNNIYFFSTTTGHTGYPFDFIADFRNNYYNVSFNQVGNCFRSRNTYTTGQFINGDSNFIGFSFCEINNSGVGVGFDIDGGTGGRNNQWTFGDINGISNDVGAGSNDIFIRFNRTTRMKAYGLNMEQFATSTQVTNSNGVYIESHKYINPTTGVAGKAIFEADVNSTNISFSCKEVEVSAATTILYDKNTSRTQPNILKGVGDANCIISDDGGSAIYSTTTASIVKDVYDNVSGATWLSRVKVLGDKIQLAFSDGLDYFIRYTSSAVGITAGGTERLSISGTGFGTTTVTGFTVNGSATSTSNVGFNLTGGCFAINNNCISGGGGAGTVTSVVAGVGFLNRGLNITNSGTLNVGIATSATPVLGRVAYWSGVGDTTNPATLTSVATSSLADGTGITITNGSSAFVLGSQPTFNCNTASASVFGCLSAAKFSEFDSATTTFGSGYATTTSGIGLTFSTTTLSFNGLTMGMNIVPTAGALTFTPTVTGTLNNAGLTNSTISGVALGSNLNALTNDATLNGSSYNGSGAISDWGLNLANPNTWTALQTFNYSSSTIYSSFINSSTTFARIGTLTLSTSTAGTLKVDANGIVWSDTSGGGGGYATIQDEGSNLTVRTILNFTGSGVACADDTTKTTCTINAGAASAGGSDTQVQYNDGSSLGGAVGWVWQKTKEIMGIGTTTPFTNHKVSIASSTAQQLTLLTGLNDNGFAFRNAGGNLYIGTTSPTTGATSTTPILTLTSGTPQLSVGSTTPWSMFSVMGNYSMPLIDVATTSGVSLFHVTATSSVLISNTVNGKTSEIGVRVGIGLWNYEGYGGLLDQLVVNGRINTQGWLDMKCDNPHTVAAISADGIVPPCPNFVFYEDNTGTHTSAGTYGYASARVTASTAAINNDGAGVFVNNVTGTSYTLASSTPVMEINARIRNSNATTSQYYIGFTNLSYAGTAFETEPTSGCYFTASSTTANWRAICRTAAGAGNMTMVDTGIASTSVTNGTSGTGYQFRKFRIEADSTRAKFYIKASGTGNLVKVAEISTTYPSGVIVNMGPGIFYGIVSNNTSSGFDYFRFRYWWKDVLPSL